MTKFFNLTDTFGFFYGGKKRYTKTPIPNKSQILTHGAPQTLNPDTWDAYNLYMTTAELQAVINLRGTLLASGTWKHYDKNGELIEDSEYVKFLENPNPLMKGNRYLMLLDQTQILHGKTFEYILKGFRSQEIPSALYQLPPREMEVELSGKWYQQSKLNEIIDGYKYNKQAIDKENIIYRWNNNSNNPLDGESILKSLYMEITNIREAKNFRNVIMTKRGALGMLTSTASDSIGSINMTDDEKRDIEKQYQQSYGNDSEQMQMLITNSPMDYKPMTFPTRDLLLFEEVNSNFLKIIDALGLNINLFSREQGSTFENLSQGLKQAYQTTIIPLGEEYAMNKSEELGLTAKGEWLELNYDDIPVLQENEKEKSEILNNKAKATKTLIDAGYSIEEVKEMIPFEKED